MLRILNRRFSSVKHKAIWDVGPIVDNYASKPTQPVTLQYLMLLGQSHSTIDSARFMHSELPKRSLPFIIGVNPHVRGVFELYLDAFNKLREFPEINDEPTQKEFSDLLKELVNAHHDIVPRLARGFSECGKYMTREAKTKFLDDMINARIGIRVLAEHHLALQEPMEGWIGIIHTGFKPARLIKNVAHYVEQLSTMNYGSSPDYIIIGDADTVIPYLPVHVEYILMELVKNAMRATVEFSNRTMRTWHPPIEFTIASTSDETTIRIRDQGGGVSMKESDRIFDYSYTTVPQYDEENEGILSTQSRCHLYFDNRIAMESGVGGAIAGFGFGLPMSRIYATYFGGDLTLKSIPGHGCDVFVRLPNISDSTTEI